MYRKETSSRRKWALESYQVKEQVGLGRTNRVYVRSLGNSEEGKREGGWGYKGEIQFDMVTWEELKTKKDIIDAIEKAEENKKREKNAFRIRFWEKVISQLQKEGGIQ